MTGAEEAALIAAAFEAIGKIVEVIRAAQSGNVSPGAATTALEILGQQLAMDSAAADSALDAKFPR